MNPYAASQQAQPRSSPDQPSASFEGERKYQTRFDWNDRRNFLRSVGPTRIAAICGILVWLKTTYELVREWFIFFLADAVLFWSDFINIVLALIWLVQGLAALYLSWLNWKYADRLREVAGGSTDSVSAWSHLHLRTAWLFAAISVLSLFFEVANWVLDQTLVQRLFPV